MKKVVIAGICILMLFSGSAWAANKSFSWLPNSESDLAGYKFYYGTQEGSFEGFVDVGIPTPENGRIYYDFTDNNDGISYYAVTAYDSNNNESDYSNVISNDPAPSAPGDLNIDIPVNVNVSVSVNGVDINGS